MNLRVWITLALVATLYACDDNVAPCESTATLDALAAEISNPAQYAPPDQREMLRPTLELATVSVARVETLSGNPPSGSRSCRAQVDLVTKTRDGIPLTQISQAIEYRVDGHGDAVHVSADLTPLASAILQRFREPIQ